MTEDQIRIVLFIIVVFSIILFIRWRMKEERDAEINEAIERFEQTRGVPDLISRLQELENTVIAQKVLLKRWSDKEAELSKQNLSLRMELTHKTEELSKYLEINQQLRSTIEHYEHATQQTAEHLGIKKCPACKRIQPVSQFAENPNTSDHLTKWCISCLTEGAPMPSDLSGTKICEKCRESRKKTSFYPSSRYDDGLSKWCKFCLEKNK